MRLHASRHVDGRDIDLSQLGVGPKRHTLVVGVDAPGRGRIGALARRGIPHPTRATGGARGWRSRDARVQADEGEPVVSDAVPPTKNIRLLPGPPKGRHRSPVSRRFCPSCGRGPITREGIQMRSSSARIPSASAPASASRKTSGDASGVRCLRAGKRRDNTVARRFDGATAVTGRVEASWCATSGMTQIPIG